MARTVRDAKLDSRSARVKLPERREPYWTVLSQGCAVGYRKGAKGGTWVARYRDDARKQHYQSLGAADDALDADGVTALSFSDAQAGAREWFSRVTLEMLDGEVSSGSYLVRDAMADYLRWYALHRKSLGRVQSNINVHILPHLGEIEVAKLSKRRIERWHELLSETPPRARTRPGADQRYRHAIDSPDAKRRRQCTANKILTILKAALNRAVDEGKVATDDGWRRVKSFQGVDAANVRYLMDDEARRLTNACAEPFRSLVVAALMTGARYGELVALRVSDLDSEAATIHVRTSKSGKGRHIVLSEEGRAFFQNATAGKATEDLIFHRDDGAPWGPSQQRRPLLLACAAAQIKPAISFHVFRHTHASRLAMRSVPLAVIAVQLGHRDTRMVEKHYGHLAPSYVADTIRAAFGEMGIVNHTNVTPLRRS